MKQYSSNKHADGADATELATLKDLSKERDASTVFNSSNYSLLAFGSETDGTNQSLQSLHFPDGNTNNNNNNNKKNNSHNNNNNSKNTNNSNHTSSNSNISIKHSVATLQTMSTPKNSNKNDRDIGNTTHYPNRNTNCNINETNTNKNNNRINITATTTNNSNKENNSIAGNSCTKKNEDTGNAANDTNIEIETVSSEQPSNLSSIHNISGDERVDTKNSNNNTLATAAGDDITHEREHSNLSNTSHPSESSPNASSIPRNRDAAMANVHKATNLSLVGNIILFITKTVVFVLTFSLAVVASLVDSMLDLVSQVIMFLTERNVKIVNEKYPVGKTRLEPVGILSVSILMVMSAVTVIREAIAMLARGSTPVSFDIFTIISMCLVIALKFGLWLYCKQFKHSPIAMALAEDHSNDVFSNAVALIAGMFQYICMQQSFVHTVYLYAFFFWF